MVTEKKVKQFINHRNMQFVLFINLFREQVKIDKKTEFHQKRISKCSSIFHLCFVFRCPINIDKRFIHLLIYRNVLLMGLQDASNIQTTFHLNVTATIHTSKRTKAKFTSVVLFEAACNFTAMTE